MNDVFVNSSRSRLAASGNVGEVNGAWTQDLQVSAGLGSRLDSFYLLILLIMAALGFGSPQLSAEGRKAAVRRPLFNIKLYLFSFKSSRFFLRRSSSRGNAYVSESIGGRHVLVVLCLPSGAQLLSG